MLSSTNTKSKFPVKRKLILTALALAVCLLLLYFVPVSESVQKTSPYTRFTADDIAQDSGEM